MIVIPKQICEHIDISNLQPATTLQYFRNSYHECYTCSSYEYDSQQQQLQQQPLHLSLCLTCNLLFCTANHIILHCHSNSHFIYANLSNISFTCIHCGYINDKRLKYHYQYLFENILNITTHALLTPLDIYTYKRVSFISKLKSNSFKRIYFMVGAGISTNAGIPDFRSKTGLFQQLRDKHNLSSPEEFFYKTTFLAHPEYFYEFCKNFDLSQTKPTTTHLFMSYLTLKKQIVKYIFTQNIDGLELKARIPKEKIVFAHGNFNEGHCPLCKEERDINVINQGVKEGKVVYCEKCGTPCKANVVFYGEQLSEEFYMKAREIKDGDLGIVMGTSLLVQPFAMLPKLLGDNAWRVVVNRSLVGKYGYEFLSENSLFIKGNTDEVVKEIVKECGWEEEFGEFVEEVLNGNK